MNDLPLTDGRSPWRDNDPTSVLNLDADIWTAPEPSTPPAGDMQRPARQLRHAGPPPKRRRGWIALTIVTALLLVGWGTTATVLAVNEHNSGVRLQRNLNSALADLDDTTAELASTTANLETVTAEREELAMDYMGAEFDRAQLDEQLEETAGAKAEAEDEREALRQLVVVASSVTSSMERCADDNAAVTMAFVTFVNNYPYGSPYAVDAALSRMESSCSKAQSDAGRLQSIVAQVT